MWYETKHEPDRRTRNGQKKNKNKRKRKERKKEEGRTKRARQRRDEELEWMAEYGRVYKESHAGCGTRTSTSSTAPVASLFQLL